MTYEATLLKLADGTERVILQLWDAVAQGVLTVDEFRALAADLVQLANSQGAAVAQLAFRAYLEAHDRAPARVTSTTWPAGEQQRLDQALATILGSDLDTAMQLGRLARNEPLDAAASAYQAELDASPRVSGWRRQVETDGCQLCQWWARERRVFQPSHRMPRHPGCTCHQVPVVDEQTTNYQTTRQARRAAH